MVSCKLQSVAVNCLLTNLSASQITVRSREKMEQEVAASEKRQSELRSSGE